MLKIRSFLWIFSLLLFVELLIVSNPDWYLYRIFTKPLIVGSLLVFFLAHELELKTKILVSIALAFTLIGDIQLIYAGVYEHLFIGGVGAFLIANIVYIFQFSRQRNKAVNFVVPSLILLLYGGTLFWYLMDALGDFMIPVALYMTTSWIMILFAYLRKDDMTDNSYIYVLAGTLLLMLSASIVAITRFKSDIPFSRVMVMLIHGSSQLCLVMGILMSDPLYKKQRVDVPNSMNEVQDK